MQTLTKTASFFMTIFILGSPAQSGVCEWVAGGVAAAGTAVASASTIAGVAGVAAVPYVTGTAILTSVGVGGTGYIAGTLGTIFATSLLVASSPAVIAGAIGVSVVGGGTATYCYFVE